MGKTQLLRGLPANRRDCAARAGHLALWAHEAGRSERSPNRADAVCGGAVAPGESARGFLQPGGISESLEVWGTGPRAALDSGTGECAISTLRADSPQHVHQFSCSAAGHVADAGASASFVCRTDLRSGRLSGIDCNRAGGGDALVGHGGWIRAGSAASRDGIRIAGPLRDSCRSETFPAGKYYV